MTKSSGLPPGTLVFVGETKTEKPVVNVIDYNPQESHEMEVKNIDDCLKYLGRSTVTWVNIDGLHETSLIEKIGRFLNIHPLILEDIANTNQRPKYDDMGDYFVIILKMISFDEKTKLINVEQMSLLIGQNYVISFQEKPGDVFQLLRSRIRRPESRIRISGADYLAYALVDAIVDNYYFVVEKIGDQIEAMEVEVMENPETGILAQLQQIKHTLLFMRKAVWPLREVIGNLEKSDKLLKKQTRPFLRDVYDHTIQIIDMLETMREMNTGLFDIYLTNISNKMNQVMKVLTIIATIFIPLTFIAGIYGMNFVHMPELSWRWGYPAVWIVMLLLAAGMMVFFKRKKWL